MLLLRAVVAPLYLVATVLVSYGSTIGLSAFVFQEVLGHSGVSPYLPLIVFVLLVALGSDYNIFLMHRIREEAETLGMKDAVRIASGHTGAVITSAGLILAGTFGSMAVAPLTMMVQVGVAVAIGVLIDTFLVRSILVPAITTIAGDWAWWPSGFRSGGAVPVPVPVGRARGRARAAVGVPVPVRCRGGRRCGAVADGAIVPGATPRDTSRRRLAVGLALVVLVPVMVAGLLTWSLGGSDGDLGSVQAAVVNLDEGGTVTTADGTSDGARAGRRPLDRADDVGHGRRVHLGRRGRGRGGRGSRRRDVRRRADDPGRVLPHRRRAPCRHHRQRRRRPPCASRPTTGPATRWATSPAR